VAFTKFKMTTQLKKTSEELEAALERATTASLAKSNFLASSSQEMRAPLNAIIGLSGQTLETGGLSAEVYANLEKIYNAGTTLLSWVNNIVDISKLETGKLELTPIDYDVPIIIFDAATQCILRSEEKPVQFVLNIGENLPSVLLGDDLRIKQIISNLLSNAFKYTSEGEVELDVRCTRDGETTWMDIVVRDTGAGIKPQDIDGLFTDYTKADLAVGRAKKNVGLGLPITKKLAEMMGGSITVESEWGKGSVFSVRIRQKAVSNAVIGPELAESLRDFDYSDCKRRQNEQRVQARLSYARVLVVDDVTINLEIVKGLLGLYGMEIDCMTNGPDAIDAIRSNKVKYNAIFMDHVMPGMDGIETTAEIRKLGTDYAKNIPIIALTADDSVEAEEMFLAKGFQAFIPKPIDAARLDTVIRDWIRNKDIAVKQVIVNGHAHPDTRSGQDRRTLLERRHQIERRGGL